MRELELRLPQYEFPRKRRISVSVLYLFLGRTRVRGRFVQNFLQSGVLDNFCECGIGLRREESGVAVVPRELQVMRGALGVACLGIRLRNEEIKQAGIGGGALQHDGAPKTATVEYGGIQR